ncbi:MAG: hypothetical protein QOI14_1538, partial [Actinomycetota bacterium]|nr:hypothetical protein [Actinomycetota bacterium]
TEEATELVHDRGFAARDDQAGHPREFCRSAHTDGVSAERFQDRNVLAEVPLEREDTDGPRYGWPFVAAYPTTGLATSHARKDGEAPRGRTR